MLEYTLLVALISIAAIATILVVKDQIIAVWATIEGALAAALAEAKRSGFKNRISRSKKGGSRSFRCKVRFPHFLRIKLFI